MNRPYGQQCLAKAVALKEVVHEESVGCTAAGAQHSLVVHSVVLYPRGGAQRSCQSQTDRLTDSMQFLVWHHSQTLHQTCLHIFQFKPCELVPDRDVDFADEMSSVKPHMCVPVESMDPLYLLYTSGTTGLPKVCQAHTHSHTCSSSPT